MDAKIEALQTTFKQESAAAKDAQQEISRILQNRQKFMQQQHENELVLQELELLEEDSKIYKLIGPVLIQQDPLEATSNVKKRLDFIQGELDRVDSQLKKLEDKQSKRHGTLRQIESQVQRMAQAAAQAEADSKGS